MGASESGGKLEADDAPLDYGCGIHKIRLAKCLGYVEGTLGRGVDPSASLRDAFKCAGEARKKSSRNGCEATAGLSK